MSLLLTALVSVLLGALGQILWKQGLRVMEFDPSLFLSLSGLTKILVNGWIPAGIVCYFLSMVLWLKALKLGELSYVYPLISLNFVILTLAGYVIFSEEVTLTRILGIALIILGILVASRS
ncbi:MAG: EamA family transporter [Candidatus Nezhaarchaeales archaeon]